MFSKELHNISDKKLTIPASTRMNKRGVEVMAPLTFPASTHGTFLMTLFPRTVMGTGAQFKERI